MRQSAVILPVLPPEGYINPKQPEQIQNLTAMFLENTNIAWSVFSKEFQAATDCTDEQLNMFALVFRDSMMTWDRWYQLQDWFCPIKRNGRPEEDGWDVKMMLDICHRPWFHGFLLVSNASALLYSTPVGTFMIRFSGSTKDHYSLSIKTSDEIVDHWRIACQREPNQPPKFYFNTTDQTFDSLDDFVKHFGPEGTGSLASRSGLRSTLVYPLAVEPSVYNMI